MAVHYAGGGGGLFDALINGIGMASTFIPGLQPFAPYLMGANALAKGDVGGAVGSVAAPAIGKEIGGIFGKAAAPATTATAAPLDDALMNAHRQASPLPERPLSNAEYVDMRLDGARQAEAARRAQEEQANIEAIQARWKPRQDALDVAAYVPQPQGAAQALGVAAQTPQTQPQDSETLFQALTRFSPTQLGPQTAFQRRWRR